MLADRSFRCDRAICERQGIHPARREVGQRLTGENLSWIPCAAKAATKWFGSAKMNDGSDRRTEAGIFHAMLKQLDIPKDEF
jgi:hypothetical protein